MTEPILQFFSYAHLPTKLGIISKPFGDLAHHLVAQLPRNAERSVAIRKLLEAKDAAVRATISTDERDPRDAVAVPESHRLAREG